MRTQQDPGHARHGPVVPKTDACGPPVFPMPSGEVLPTLRVRLRPASVSVPEGGYAVGGMARTTPLRRGGPAVVRGALPLWLVALIERPSSLTLMSIPVAAARRADAAQDGQRQPTARRARLLVALLVDHCRQGRRQGHRRSASRNRLGLLVGRLARAGQRLGGDGAVTSSSLQASWIRRRRAGSRRSRCGVVDDAEEGALVLRVQPAIGAERFEAVRGRFRATILEQRGAGSASGPGRRGPSAGRRR